MDSLFNTGLVVVNIVFPILATGAVLLRFYARKGGGRYSIFLDDWLIVATLFFCWANTANSIVGSAQIGVNKAKVDIMKQTIVTVRTLWIEGFLLATALALIKMSILQFYYRIFVTKCNVHFKWAILATHGIIVGWWLSSIFCQLLVTDPIRASWNPTIPFKYRYNYNTWSITFASMSLFFDVVILLFPLPVIGKLRMDFKRKMSVMGIFWLGAFCCIAAAVRLYFLYTEIYKVTGTPVEGNPYKNITNGFIWAHIEPNCSIIAACLPTYGTLFHSGRSAHSLIRSFRSIFTISSRTNSGLTKSRSSKGALHTGDSSQHSLAPAAAGAGYYELREDMYAKENEKDSKNAKTTVTVETPVDVEAQRHLGGIGVTREFRTESRDY